MWYLIVSIPDPCPLSYFDYQLLCLCCEAALKSLPELSFDGFNIPILRIMCTLSFHYSFPGYPLCHGILVQLWYLIVSIPDPCPLSYFDYQLLCLCCVAALKSLTALSFNALVILILGIVCTLSFHYSFPWISSMSCTAFKNFRCPLFIPRCITSASFISGDFY